MAAHAPHLFWYDAPTLMQGARMNGTRPANLAARTAVAFAAVLLLQAASRPARAESAGDFYKSHPLSIVIGYSVANAYDLYARTLGRHIGRHIPGNPTVVPVNKPGAGSMTALNYLYSVAPKDGSTIGIFNRSAAMEPLLGQSGATFDPRKFTWLGSVGNEVSLCVAWHTAAVKSWSDLQSKDFVVAASGLSADTGVFALLLKNLFGARIKIITGYPGGAEMSKAIEAGEVDGRCGWSWSAVKASKPQWLSEGKINVLMQLGLQKSADLPNVPLIMDVARNEEERRILKLVFSRQEFAWPFVAPPGLPQERKQVLRQAFEATLKDPEFLAEAKRTALDVNPVTGPAVENLIDEIYATPEELAAKVRRLMRLQ
jgi:tripartite-type tricarboxylate transporter receptor subunit TctC